MILKASTLAETEGNLSVMDVQDEEDSRGLDPSAVEEILNKISPEGKIR